MFPKLLKWFEKASNVLIIFHESPDGDAVASSLALGSVLCKKGKNVDLACRDEIPEVFRFLPGTENIKRDFILGDYDLICTVDCGDARRTGFYSRIIEYSKNKTRLVNIDHHVKNDLHKIAHLNVVDESAAASAEIIHRIITEMGLSIDKQIATLLLTGLYTDTGGFQHSNTCPRVYSLASKLLAKGASLGKISKNILLNKKLTSLRLWGVAMSRVWQNSWGIAISYITLGDIEKLGAQVDDVSGIVNLINSIPDARAAILFTEIAGCKIRASVRTEKDVDMAVLARLFGGGGHKKAAGFTLDGKIVTSANGTWHIDLV